MAQGGQGGGGGWTTTHWCPPPPAVPHEAEAEGDAAQDRRPDQVNHGVAGARRGHLLLHVGPQGLQGHGGLWDEDGALGTLLYMGRCGQGGWEKGRRVTGRWWDGDGWKGWMGWAEIEEMEMMDVMEMMKMNGWMDRMHKG